MYMELVDLSTLPPKAPFSLAEERLSKGYKHDTGLRVRKRAPEELRGGQSSKIG